MKRRFSFDAGPFLGAFSCLLLATAALQLSAAQTHVPPSTKDAQQQLVWLDTDIGDDIDDAFALGLILKSPQCKVLGISTTFGNTELRAQLLDRFLATTGNSPIPVTAGAPTRTDNVLSQSAYAQQWPKRKHQDAIAAMLQQIRLHPGQVTLIALGPLFNIGAAIDRDPATFRKLKRVVMMGGSIQHGYTGNRGEQRSPDPEWNILQDPKGAAALFAAEIPIYMTPLDSTQVPLPAEERDRIFAYGSPLTDQVTLLYHQWMMLGGNRSATPTLYDPVAAAYALDPELCPMQAMRIAIEPSGVTKVIEGQPNAQVCLKSDEAAFLRLLMDKFAPKGK